MCIRDRSLPFHDLTFDLVVCLEGIEHVSANVGEAFIIEVTRVIRPGGMFFLSSPHCRMGEHSGNPYHLKEYRPEELVALIEPHFDIVDVITREVDNLIVSYFQARRHL